MRRVFRTLLVTFALVGLLGGAVQAETPRRLSLELKFGPYFPEIDDRFADSSKKPYADIFGTDMMWMIGPYLEYHLYQKFGTLALGVGIRYGWVTGFAKRDDGTSTDEETSLHIVPITLGLTYRFDVLATRFNVPVVPYLKGGFTCAIWWATNAKGEIANTYTPALEEALGASYTFGVYGGAGFQLLLDGLSPRMAASMDSEAGVNNTYLFVEYVRHALADFGSARSMKLSSHTVSFGLMFDF